MSDLDKEIEVLESVLTRLKELKAQETNNDVREWRRMDGGYYISEEAAQKLNNMGDL